mmetsp:Transcript_8370/g.25281  ORF Transcript_8370/g.25281 Transcript_8370/m.25281 type:complete len:117 (-) Transcript_8370:7233-7583(-)
MGIFPAILHSSNHVLKGTPADRAVVKVFFKEQDAALKVAIVVFVRYAPTEWAKLPSLLHHTMEKAQSEQKLPPLCCVNPFDFVLVYHHTRCVASQEAGLQSRWWLIRDLGTHLKQS